MPIYRLNDDPNAFPDPHDADESGLLAVGGDLSPERLLTAYSMGIFPWYSEGQPILWHSPDPRFTLIPDQLHVSKSLKKVLRSGEFEVRLDSAFSEVIRGCAQVPRRGQDGTWITAEMIAAYEHLHALGFAHSAEAWRGGKLVGGLYGVTLGGVFFGESMFAQAENASKVAFASLVERLRGWGFVLIDCQQETEHLARFGAQAWPRELFLQALEQGLGLPGKPGSWRT